MSKEIKLVPFHVPKVLYENRYCNQEGFSILICGGNDKNEKTTSEVFELEIPSLKVNKFPSMVKPYFHFVLATIKSKILAVGNSLKINEFLDESLHFFEVYSEKTKTWTHQVLI